MTFTWPRTAAWFSLNTSSCSSLGEMIRKKSGLRFALIGWLELAKGPKGRDVNSPDRQVGVTVLR